MDVGASDTEATQAEVTLAASTFTDPVSRRKRSRSSLACIHRRGVDVPMVGLSMACPTSGANAPLHRANGCWVGAMKRLPGPSWVRNITAVCR